MEPESTGHKTTRHLSWHGFIWLFGCFAGFLAIFSLVVTIFAAFQEYMQSYWPEATASIQNCSVKRQNTSEEDYYVIDCLIGYVVSDQIVMSHVLSRSLRAPERIIWELNAGQTQQMLDKMREWVDAHPPGMLINVHYNPSSYGKSALVTTDMPLGGPQTQSNVAIAVGFAAISIAMLAIGAIARRFSMR